MRQRRFLSAMPRPRERSERTRRGHSINSLTSWIILWRNDCFIPTPMHLVIDALLVRYTSAVTHAKSICSACWVEYTRNMLITLPLSLLQKRARCQRSVLCAGLILHKAYAQEADPSLLQGMAHGSRYINTLLIYIALFQGYIAGQLHCLSSSVILSGASHHFMLLYNLLQLIEP